MKKKALIGIIGGGLICFLGVHILTRPIALVDQDGNVVTSLINSAKEKPDAATREKMWIAALERNLGEMICEIDAVEDANVLITTHDVDAPTVSAVIKTHTGENLSSNQVEAISALLLNSVAGETADNISIVTADGQVLK
ncbi:MAG: hypothetical protein IKC03_03480 [Oscillospiraceae bacterium]|nr:hypothetical protein [Oscillospiraceae bacterium]